MPAIVLALLLGSIVVMGVWIHEAPDTQVRPTLPVSTGTVHNRHIDARPLVQRLGVVKASMVREASALVKSRKHPGIYWTLCDSGNPPYLYAIDLQGKLHVTLQLKGVQNVDWEALTMDDQGRLYVGDIGNNYHNHKTRSIYRIDEPDQLESATPFKVQTVPVTGIWHYRFPQKPFDAESLLIQDNTFWIISKVKNMGNTELYRLPITQNESTAVLEKVGDLPAELVMIADAAISPDSKRLALTNKFYSVIFQLPTGKVTDILTSPPTYYEYDLHKVEGCAWDGNDLILISEDRKIYRLPIPPEVE